VRVSFRLYALRLYALTFYAQSAHRDDTPDGRSLKTQQRGRVEVDVLPGEPARRTAEAIDGFRRLPE
jgi:hypothetical protein